MFFDRSFNRQPQDQHDNDFRDHSEGLFLQGGNTMGTFDPCDALVELLKRHMPETVYLVKNHPRYEEVTETIREISDFFRENDENAEITVAPDELVGTMLAVEVKTYLLCTTETKALARFLAKADSLDVVPLTDGRVQLILGFDKAYKPYEGQ